MIVKGLYAPICAYFGSGSAICLRFRAIHVSLELMLGFVVGDTGLIQAGPHGITPDLFVPTTFQIGTRPILGLTFTEILGKDSIHDFH